jgi:hypothetical protein
MNRDDQVFWDRLQDMPWVEAEAECVRRREEVALQKNMLDNTLKAARTSRERDDIVAGLNDCNSQLTLLNERIKWLRKTQAQANLKEACRQVLDADTFAEVCVRTILLEQDAIAKCPPPLVPYLHHARS